MSASITTISTPLTLSSARAERDAVLSERNAAPADRGTVRPERVAASVRAGQASRRTRLRLTARGRAVFGTLATLLIIGALALVAMFSGSQAVASVEGGGADFGYVVVQPGDSLWQLASELDPNTDPRDLVAEIVRLNQLDGSGVQAGQPIAVPLRYADAPGVVGASEAGL